MPTMLEQIVSNFFSCHHKKKKKTPKKLNYMKQLFLDIGQQTVIPERRKINEVKSVIALGFCLESLSGPRSEKEKPLKSTVVSVS